MSQARFQKMQREKARREKAAAKQARKADRAARVAEEGDEVTASKPQDEVLAQLAELHKRYEDGGMSFEDFEAVKEELMQSLRVD